MTDPPKDPTVPLTTRLADLRGRSFIVSDGARFGDVLVVTVDDGPREQVTRITMAFYDGEAPPISASLPSGTTLGDAVTQVLDMKPREARSVAAVRWAGTAGSARPGMGSLLALLLPSVAISVLAGVNNAALGAIAGVITLVLVLILWVLTPRGSRRATIALDENGKPALLRPPDDVTPATPRRIPPPNPGRETTKSAVARIDHLKAVYGGLLSDVVYRIENSALFDSAQPLTRDFQLLLMRWNEEHEGLAPAEQVRLARRLEIAFETARRHAETVGIAHLPQTARADGERAAKAARLAVRATSEGERDAALAQANRLLRSLALYYLPDPDETPRMLGGRRPELRAPGSEETS